MRFEDFAWTLVPLEPEQGRGRLTIRISRNEDGRRCVLYLSMAVRKALKITTAAEVLVNGQAIAVRAADRRSQAPRRVVKSTGQMAVTGLIRDVLQVQPGEAFRLPVVIDAGHGIAMLPDELVRRMKGSAA